MTDAELDEIEKRARQVSIGPWMTRGGDVFRPSDPSFDMGNEWFRLFQKDAGLASDATFIAHARTDVPALVAEVRKLKALLRRVEEQSDACLECRDVCGRHTPTCELGEAIK